MKIKEFKLRASAAELFLTEPRKKGEVLSETAKSYIKDIWLREQIYNRKVEIQKNQMKKGTENQSESIEMINNFCKLQLRELSFEVDKKENDFFTGCGDSIDYVKNYYCDIKNSWSWETFPLFDTQEEIYKKHAGQMNVYFNLYGITKGFIGYTLTDASEVIIQSEAWKYARFNNIEYSEAEEIIREKLTYFDVPLHLKIRNFEFDYNPEIINTLQNKVLAAREYINNLLLTL